MTEILIPLPSLKALETIQTIDRAGFMEDGILIGDNKVVSASHWLCLFAFYEDVPASSEGEEEKYWVIPLEAVRKCIKDGTSMLVKFEDGKAYHNDIELTKKKIRLRGLFKDADVEQPGKFCIQLPLLSLLHRAAKKQNLSYAYYKMLEPDRYICWWANDTDWYAVFMGARADDNVSIEERRAIIDIMAGKEPLF